MDMRNRTEKSKFFSYCFEWREKSEKKGKFILMLFELVRTNFTRSGKSETNSCLAKLFTIVTCSMWCTLYSFHSTALYNGEQKENSERHLYVNIQKQTKFLN